jgi:hypothetical protein
MVAALWPPLLFAFYRDIKVRNITLLVGLTMTDVNVTLQFLSHR